MSDEDDCQIVEDNTNYKSITCEKIPDLFLDKLIAKKHFGKYGKITRFVLRPNRFCCTVEYEREEEAANALENAAFFNGQQFDIRYSQREVGHVQNTEEWVDPDVQAELDAMGNHARRLPQVSVPKPVASATRIKPKSARSAPDPPASNVPKVSSAAKSELEAILRKPAYTDEDKYRILDARDKLIRLTTVRTTDINKVVSIKGTCPDMCPEKERFMREFQHQVASFEMEEGGNRNQMNHSIAVKEYSRSSADQEVPLTHELRPEPVLKMTMLYLMHRIMGLCDVDDVNIGDWFHFVWDRTRSIRKDITQQELCSTGAVELVEQCARFHIHCAARLVAEDPSVFDQKINTENLTKCLQTLKYMYNDLRIKGIRCEREAEFRGYIVLLNLNDSNFLWELQQLPEEIQNSNEVRSAINFYKCMESNNYVRFFNLVRETTYMNACILLRYFTQVRLKALRMIMKAYNWPRHLVSLPLNYLTKILGFENADAAVDFFTYYGLECDQDNVRLDKNAFEEPDVPVLMERAFELVESKRQVGVGEAVCGHPLESANSFANHQPHDSFDSNGYLRYESFTADDQVKDEGSHKTPTRTISDTVFKVPAPSPPINPKHQLKSIFASTPAKSETETKPANMFGQPTPPTTSSIFSQKSSSTAAPVAISVFKMPGPAAPITAAPLFSSSVFEQKSKADSASSGLFRQEGPNIFGSAANSFAKDNVFQHFDAKPFAIKAKDSELSFMALEEQREKERQMKLQEEEKSRKVLEEHKQKEEEQERQRRLVEERQRQQHLEEDRRKAVLTKITEKAELVLKDLLNEVEQDQINQIASKELQDHLRIEKLAENVIFEYISEYIQKIHSEELSIIQRDQSLLHKCFHSWRDLTHKMKTQRKLVSAMPVWMTADTLGEQAARMAHPRQEENLQMIKRYRQGLPCDFKMLLVGEELGVPIDLFAILRSQFSAQQKRSPSGFLKRRKYFKIIISIPGERDELPGLNSYTTNWLAKNTKRYYNKSTPAFLCHADDELALCIRTVSCITPKNERNQKVTTECDNADALLFFMSIGNPINSRKRLHHLLKLSTINRSVPVAVVMYNSPAADIAAVLDLNSLGDDGKISSFHVFYTNDQMLKSDIRKSLRFLGQKDNYVFPLETQNIVSFLDVCIGNELWQRLHKSWSTNPSFRKICSIPRLLIAIYNEAVSRLIEIIDEDFQDYPDFPEELRQFVPQSSLGIPVGLEQFSKNWKDVNNTWKLINFLKKLSLPPVTEDPPQKVDDLELWVMDYTSACISEKNTAFTTGFQAVKYLIEELNQSDLQEHSVDERLPFISWLPIIRQIASAVLIHQWSSMNIKLSNNVVYARDEFNEFQSNPWWLESNSVKSVKMSHEAVDHPMNEAESTEDIGEIIARAEKVSADTDDKLLKLKRAANAMKINPELTRELDNTLYSYEVNEKCRSFESSATGLFTDDEDSLEIPPVAKKPKVSPDDMNMNEVMERAFAILNNAESFLDCQRIPKQLEAGVGE